jgi:hypothetical protein
MGDMSINLNPQQFNLGDGAPNHIEPGAAVLPKFEKRDRALKDHIFHSHIQTKTFADGSGSGKMFSVPEGVTDAIAWHESMHAKGEFEHRRAHTHE